MNKLQHFGVYPDIFNLLQWPLAAQTPVHQGCPRNTNTVRGGRCQKYQSYPDIFWPFDKICLLVYQKDRGFTQNIELIWV